MTKFTWPLHKAINVSSVCWHESQRLKGVRYATKRASLSERLELMKAMRELVSTNEFLKAGNALEQTEAAIGDLLARKLYLKWGLTEVSGLKIDGRLATPIALIEKGPEELCDEIVETIRSGLALSADERKN